MNKAIKTDGAPQAPAVLSQAIEANGLVFVAGQVHNMPDGTMVTDSVAAKLEQIMSNCQQILATAESSLDDVVNVTIYVTDMAQMPELNENYAQYFSEPLPARAAVCVKELPLGATIEIVMVAAK